MTHEEKKKWLSRFRDGHIQLERLKEQRARADSFGKKITVSYGGMPGGGGGADKIQLSVERKAEIDEEIARIRQNLPAWEREAAKAIAAIQNPDHRRVMWYYYIERLTWAETAQLSGYGQRYVRDIRDKVVLEI